MRARGRDCSHNLLSGLGGAWLFPSILSTKKQMFHQAERGTGKESPSSVRGDKPGLVTLLWPAGGKEGRFTEPPNHPGSIHLQKSFIFAYWGGGGRGDVTGHTYSMRKFWGQGMNPRHHCKTEPQR